MTKIEIAKALLECGEPYAATEFCCAKGGSKNYKTLKEAIASLF